VLKYLSFNVFSWEKLLESLSNPLFCPLLQNAWNTPYVPQKYPRYVRELVREKVRVV
jgi:hypothetical protein